MLKKIVLLGLMVALGAALSVPAFAAAGVQGTAANVSAADNVALGSTGVGQPSTVACRAYSVSGTDTGINTNQPGCENGRACKRNYVTLGGFGLPGGYLCGGENTGAYNADADNQTFYQLIDGEANAGACNHAGYYAVQGMIASNGTVLNPVGDFRQAACAGTTAGNCFTRNDSTNARATQILNVNAGYQGAHALGSIGGLSPVPTVRVALPSGTCAAGQARLTWDDPETYSLAMKGGAPSPTLGVRLYSNNSPCSTCPDGSNGWTAGAVFGMGAGATGVCVPVSGDTWYALTVRFKGPGNAVGSEIESGRVGSTGFVGSNSQCVGNPATASRITNLSARYAGRGNVNVSWTTGTEGGLQGFYVTRGASASGPFERVSTMVNPQGDGHSYAVSTQAHAALGRVQYYSIEIVNADGTSEHSGPTAINLPASKKKLGTH